MLEVPTAMTSSGEEPRLAPMKGKAQQFPVLRSSKIFSNLWLSAHQLADLDEQTFAGATKFVVITAHPPSKGLTHPARI